MRNIGLIVARELAAYARTPSGYFIAAAVLVVDGLFFNGLAMGDDAKLSADVLRDFFYFAGIVTMCGGVLLSIRLLSEERWTGTDVLLLTSPITEAQIVVGKYLAALAFLTILTLASLYLPALIFVNGKVSWGHIASGYIGLILLGGTVLALGMFASSLSKNKYLSVLITLFVTILFVVVLELAWVLGQNTDPPLGEMIAYVALHTTHFSPFYAGILQLSSVVFYLSVIYLCLLASTKVLASQRWR